MKMKGIACVPCLLFGPTEVENDCGKVSLLSSSVTKSFHKFEKIRKQIKNHLQNNYHHWAQERGDSFLLVMEMTGSSVINQLDDFCKQQVLENRQ
jgi:hypothetical protein